MLKRFGHIVHSSQFNCRYSQRFKKLQGNELLLQPSDAPVDENLCLLLRAKGCELLEDGQSAVKCQYIGTVVALNQSKNHQIWRWVNITLGADELDNSL